MLYESLKTAFHHKSHPLVAIASSSSPVSSRVLFGALPGAPLDPDRSLLTRNISGLAGLSESNQLEPPAHRYQTPRQHGKADSLRPSCSTEQIRIGPLLQRARFQNGTVVPLTVLREQLWPPSCQLQGTLWIRHGFRSTPTRKDLFGFGVFSCSIPMFKSYLLSLTRATLIVLPFWYRWRLARHFPRASRTLLTIPLFAMCLVVAIGIDQSPRTHRWRLLLMTEREEVEWSHRRFEDVLASEGHLILASDDPRTQLVKKICDRLVTALDLDSPVSAVTWPRDNFQTREKITRIEARKGISPSATTGSALMPWQPETSNPEKVLESCGWDLFIIDLPRIDAFVLPTKEIFVYAGLLDLLDQNETLTAAILAHEVSHVLERHAVENMGFSALSAVVFDVIRGISFALTISFPVVSDGLATMINYLNSLVSDRAYSTKLEAEADELGMTIMARAGYDPRATLSVWNFLNRLEQDQRSRGAVAGADQIPWTHTHPPGQDREQAIEQALARAMKCFQKPAALQASTPASTHPSTNDVSTTSLSPTRA